MPVDLQPQRVSLEAALRDIHAEQRELQRSERVISTALDQLKAMGSHAPRGGASRAAAATRTTARRRQSNGRRRRTATRRSADGTNTRDKLLELVTSKPMSRAEITKALGVSSTRVTQLTQELAKDKKITASTQPGERGRPVQVWSAAAAS